MGQGSPSARRYLVGRVRALRARLRLVAPHLDRITSSIAALAWSCAVLLEVFIVRLEHEGTPENASPHRSGALSYALTLTVIFLLAGPLVIGYGRLVVSHLYATAHRSPLWLWLRERHLLVVALLAGPATLLAETATDNLSTSVWPMPGRNVVDVLSYRVGVLGVIVLCSEGLYQAGSFLVMAHTKVDDPGNERTIVERCLDHGETDPFDRAHSYSAWGFALVGALQLPIMLVLVPHLSSLSAVAATSFIIALLLLGPLLFQLPRVWQRHALEDELDRRLGSSLERSPRPGEQDLALVRVYEHVLSRLRGRGLALSLPALGLAGLLKLDEVRKAVQSLVGVGP